jgi:hypothetical protein
MRPRKRILVTILVAIAILYSSFYVFLAVRGKYLIIKKLEKITQKKVSIGDIDFSPPLKLKIKNLDIQDLVKAQKIDLSLSVIGFLSGNLIFNNVDALSPEFTFVRSPSNKNESTLSSVSADVIKSKGKQAFVIFKWVKIKDGKVNFLDQSAGNQGIKIAVTDIDFSLEKAFSREQGTVINFSLNGKIPWQEGKTEGKIEARGWLNPYRKDIEAVLNIKDIDGISLYPYYSNWVDLEKARIDKANLNFSSKISGINNNVTAECSLELTDIVRRPIEPEEKEEKAAKITDVVLDMFKAQDQGKIALNFTIKTKMDRPEFGFGNLKMAFEDKLSRARRGDSFIGQSVLMLPGNIIEGVIKGGLDVTKVLINGTFGIFKEFEKAADRTFKKNPNTK